MAQSQLSITTDEAQAFKLGLLSAFGAYLLWGVVPGYYKLTAEVPAAIVICYRILGSVLFVGGYLALVGKLHQLREIVASKRTFFMVCLATLLVTTNWLVFIYSVEADRILDASLGYFINPLVSVALGVVFLKERLSKGQVLALAISLLAVLYQTFLLGIFPWISLYLAISFALYGLVRKRTPVGALSGQLGEVLIATPVALFGLAYFGSIGMNVVPHDDPWLLVALIGTGLVTAVPLTLFAYGARRLPLTYIGFMQYVAPSLQFILAVWVWNETLSWERFLSFAVIWCALAIFTIDSVYGYRKRRAAR
ncbi:EamA family transporter RarD [Pseudovibrio sp. SPO723]|uniref:EamA family transporter RarD n=1 Tax=Nesiotobacter zosterae TaxID=392721 RepID=UPI0029C2864A|nr:EamA family transporter RarD [Pseudovibrio sp. SPO723]MDX5593718.1 EamA family transporter RarD [Pseudovibrio sp. SPO723]